MAISKQGESSQNWLSDAIEEEVGADEGAIYAPVKGDKLPNLKRKRAEAEKQKGSKGKATAAMGSVGGAIGSYWGPVGGLFGRLIGSQVGRIIESKEGGQIESNLKTQKKNTAKKKRVVRGVGVAKRGYGKATYSKKMY